MTENETRQLGIEFERRLQTLDPSFEIIRKLDTDTIYAYLNEAQEQMFTNYYNISLQLTGKEANAAYVNQVLAPFIKQDKLNQNTSVSEDPSYNKITRWQFPPDYYVYINSFSTVTGTYLNKPSVYVQNKFVKFDDFNKHQLQYNDRNAIIRNPIASIYTRGNSGLQVRSDEYTTVTGVTLTYYTKPQPMYVSHYGMTPCQFSNIAFNELVNFALSLYVSYAKGAMLAQKEQKDKEKDEQQ